MFGMPPLDEGDRVGLWLNLERQRLRKVSVVREAVEGAADKSDPSDAYYEALSDYPEEADLLKYDDLASRSDRRMRSCPSPLLP